MMKRRLSALLACLVLAAALTGCGGSGAGAGAAAGDMTGASAEMSDRDESLSTGIAVNTAAPEGRTEAQEAKRIYTANLSLETTAFDDASAALASLVDSCGGWLENSSVGNYGSGYRSASYTVRVPAERFEFFLAQVGELCHVTWQDTSCQDVSEYYYDTEGRLRTQQTKLERLQALLARAETMEDIITIESAISETEEAIESLTGELSHYDALVDYSTVYLDLQEVYRLSDTEEPAQGFGQRLGAAFVSGWRGFVSGIQGLAIALAYGWVWLIVVAGAAVLVFRSAWKKHRRAAAERSKVPPVKPIDLGDKSEKL